MEPVRYAYVWVNTGKEEFPAYLVTTDETKEGMEYIEWEGRKTCHWVKKETVRHLESGRGRRCTRRRGAPVAVAPHPQQEDEQQQEEEEPAEAIDLTLDEDDASTSAGGNSDEDSAGSPGGEEAKEHEEEAELGVNNDSNQLNDNEQEQNEPAEDDHNDSANENICLLDSDSSDSEEEEVNNDNNSINNNNGQKQDELSEEEDLDSDSSSNDDEEEEDLSGEEASDDLDNSVAPEPEPRPKRRRIVSNFKTPRGRKGQRRPQIARISPLPEETEESDPSLADDGLDDMTEVEEPTIAAPSETAADAAGNYTEDSDLSLADDATDAEEPTISPRQETATTDAEPPSSTNTGAATRGSDDKPYLIQDYEFCCATCRCECVLPSTKDYSVRFCFSKNQAGCLHRLCCHGLLESESEETASTFPVSKGEIACTNLNLREANESTSTALSTQGKTHRPAYFKKGDNNRKVYFLEGAKYRWALWGRLVRKQDNKKLMEEVFPLTRPVNLAMTAPRHQSNLAYHEEVKGHIAKNRQAKQNGITVMDFFAGHGTGLVALKKNGIRVNKYIVVEWDQAAVHVLKCNHDPQYRESLSLPRRGSFDRESDDGTKFVYIENFEHVSIKAILKEHGPIDLVLGSPECKDYSKVNANGMGVDGESGSQHVQLGKMIQELESLQQQRWQHKLYFLVENVTTTLDDKTELEEAYGIPTIDLDACEFSPCHRLRSFHTNLPLVGSDGYLKGDDDCGVDSGAKMCLEDGYALPADWMLDENNGGSKCLTFMASKGRIDDSDGRMRVVKFWYDVDGNGNQILKGARRYMNVVERTRIMGYHDDYVREPLRLLFQALTPAFRGGHVVGFDWDNDLPKEYHCFAGLPHSFTGNDQSLELAPPTIKGKPQYYFDEEMYGKHLIGNAYSVPVVARLLQPLKDIFVSGEEYEGLQYQYYWARRFN